MREIHDHKCPGKAFSSKVAAVDEPGSDGANHQYSICLDTGTPGSDTIINFQNGPLTPDAPTALLAGVNGIHNEDLLAVVIDRLRGFQGGPFACRENALALTKIEEGLLWLKKRTLDRISRGVEGTLIK